MAVSYASNWNNIIKALMSKIKAEMKCPVFSDWNDVTKTNQFVKLTPVGSMQGDVTRISEHRTFNINMQFFFIDRKNRKFQEHVLDRCDILESLIHDNPTISLADSTTAYNVMIGDLDLAVEPEDEYEDYFIAGWGFSCEHLSNLG